MKITRYNVSAYDQGDGPWLEADPHPGGDWVKWEDVQKLLAELRELKKAAKKKP